MSAWFATNDAHFEPEDQARLRRLVQLLTSSHTSSTGLIRTRVAALSPWIIRWIESRASRLALYNSAFEPITLGFKQWSKAASGDELTSALQTLLIQGGRRVSGRRRTNGKQSAPRFEPSIAALPKTRINTHGQAGGRPERDDLRLLISFLAIDWLQSTGLQPDNGRSDHTPFGALVFMVFRWIGEEDKAAHSLRTYWSPPKPRPKNKPSAALSQG